MPSTVEDNLVVRLEATLRKFERQMEAARAAAEKAATGSERAWQKAGTQMAANANRAATGLQRITNISGSGRFVLQNTANQIGDLAVQIGSGTSASRALGQQLPQLLGGFGALGGTLGLLGPLLGTAAALAIPLGVAFLATGEKAQSLDDQLKDLSKALDALEAAQKRASTSAVDLVADYGSMADEARALFEIERQMAQIRAQSALDTATQGVADSFGLGDAFIAAPQDIENYIESLDLLKEKRDEILAYISRPRAMQDALPISEIERLQDELSGLEEQIGALDSVSASFGSLQTELGITADQAKQVAVLFAEVGRASGAQDQADALADVVEYIRQVTGNLSSANDEGQELVDNLVDAALKALDLAKVDIASTLYDGADAAGVLRDELASALALFNQLSLAQSKEYSGRGGDPRDFMPGGSQADYESAAGYKSVDQIIADLMPKAGKSRSGGGGGGSRIDKRETEAARIFEQTRTAAEKYAAELENLNQLREAGYLTEDTHMRAVQQLGEEMNKTAGLGQQMGATISDALADMVVNFDNARDAAAGLLQNLAKMVASSAFKSLGLDALFGSIFPSANGNVFSGGRPVTAFASGGVVSRPTLFPMRGGTGLMGEAGPEAIMPLMRGADGRLGVQAAGGRDTVSVHVSLTDDLQGRIESTSQRVAVQITQQSLQSYDRQLAQSVRRVNRDPRKIS